MRFNFSGNLKKNVLFFVVFVIVNKIPITYRISQFLKGLEVGHWWALGAAPAGSHWQWISGEIVCGHKMSKNRHFEKIN